MHNGLSCLQSNVILALLSNRTQIIFRKSYPPKPTPSLATRVNLNWYKPVRLIPLPLPAIGLLLDMWCNYGQWRVKEKSPGGILGMFSLLLRRRQIKRRSCSPSGFFVFPGFDSWNCYVSPDYTPVLQSRAQRPFTKAHWARSSDSSLLYGIIALLSKPVRVRVSCSR